MDVIVIGGGLAGLINAIRLSRKGYEVLLLERKAFPFHRVCGEYISNEVRPFLQREGLFPVELGPSKISRFMLSSPNGRSFTMPLDLGGFGISRFAFDNWLANKAKESGVEVRCGEAVVEVNFQGDLFEVRTMQGIYTCKVVIGCYGKRSVLDRDLKRKFMQKPSPYLGVKYHLETDLMPSDQISLHNFEGGYCGISQIEDEKFNLCYLSRRAPVKKAGSIAVFEEAILFRNPFLKELFTSSDFLFDKPKVINEISFAPKEPIYNHIIMAGDAAGMITPLSGNGMAMAIHAAKMASELVSGFLRGEISRTEMEQNYAKEWLGTFRLRHWAGRKIQHLFGSSWSANLAVGLGKNSKAAARFLMKQTHGKPF